MLTTTTNYNTGKLWQVFVGSIHSLDTQRGLYYTYLKEFEGKTSSAILDIDRVQNFLLSHNWGKEVNWLAFPLYRTSIGAFHSILTSKARKDALRSEMY
mgnify:FL=1